MLRYVTLRYVTFRLVTRSCFPFRCSYGGIDARRKNATRESTNTLKAWLYEHRKNPYPTKGEKVMLAIITKMTLTQVSTWFANARRRLKKDNRTGWEGGSKGPDDDDEDDDMDEICEEDIDDIDDIDIAGDEMHGNTPAGSPLSERGGTPTKDDVSDSSFAGNLQRTIRARRPVSRQLPVMKTSRYDDFPL